MWNSGAFGYLSDYLIWWLLFLSLVVHAWCFFRFGARSTHRRTRLVVGNLLILACLLGGVGLAAESYFRFVAVQTDSFGVSLPARRWFAIHTRLNSLGCRDDEWAPDKPAGVYRIAFLGDSFTYGWGIEDPRDRFTGVIQRRFDDRAPGRVEVLNVAKAGWGTQDQIKPASDLVERFAVDEIVLCYVPNDIEKLLPVSSEFNPIRPPQPILFNPDSSPLLDYLYRRIYLPRVPTVRGYQDWLAEGYADAGIWRRQQESLLELIGLCNRLDVRLRAVLLPFIRTGGVSFQTRTVHGMLKQFFESHGVSVVDLAPVTFDIPPSSLVVNSGDAHPNETAHALFAEAIWSAFYDAATRP